MRWEEELRAAARTFAWPQVAELTDRYVRYLRSSADPVPPAQAKQILALLRENRRHDELLRVADALLGHGLEDATVRRQLAQALVDRDSPGTSLLVFRMLVEDPNTPPGERVEAQGGIGRCYKQMYVLNTASARRSRYLQLALAAYRKAYDEDHERYWLGINVVALLARADREGIGLAEVADAAAAAKALAGEVLATVEGLPDPDAWALATACEACLALGRHLEAVDWASRFVADRDADPFKIAAVLRQFVQVWQLDSTSPPGDALLPLLRSALLEQAGGSLLVATRDVRGPERPPAAEVDLEKVLGAERYQSLTWYRTGLERCRAVARIETATAEGVGTGFLTSGAALHPSLPQTVLVTNGHVVPEWLDPREAYVVFRGLDGDAADAHRFRVVRSWWYEPSARPHLDTTVLELDGQPDGVVPVPVAPVLPELSAGRPTRTYLIGHPRGLDQPQFTLQDNVLLDYDDTWVHYRSPTEPGSSGSPVFDDQWQLLALHHAGGFDTPRLHGRGGTYAANEGIAIRAVAAALQARPPVPEDVGP